MKTVWGGDRPQRVEQALSWPTVTGDIMYQLARKALFLLPTEASHHLSLNTIALSSRLGLLKHWSKPVYQPVEVMGLTFPNPVGLAAGLDKNGDYFNALAELGFGFVEIGTITPRPQLGNPKPRLFRLPEHQAIINRMGFNNLGVDHLVMQVRERRFKGILGINIGKNFDTPVENASDDYRLCMEKVYAHADYIAVNISSPNTPGLRDLQHAEQLNELLETLKQTQTRLADEQGTQNCPRFRRRANRRYGASTHQARYRRCYCHKYHLVTGAD